ncbi:GSCOCG00011251001-RA-CDS [Cotesia congregata]|nr:GSCOCG00011251001-RA-CDS [Cotesia congregata]
MVNRCVVNGCTSGSVSDRNKHSKLGTKNPSLFTVPQHPDLLELWESELNQKLVPKKNYVCELHFNEEDIIKSDKIKTANGIIEELVRKRYALKQGAIPTLNPKKLSESRNTKDVNSPNSPSTEPVASEPNNIVYINENCSHQDSELQIDEDCNNNYDRLENFNSRISSEEINHENQEPVYELPISEVNIEEFSLQTIVNALKFNALPENWSWTTDLLDSKKLVLCYIDKVSMKLKFRVKINQNFKVWLSNIKTDKLIDLNKSFSNISDFWNFLRESVKYTLCDGTGFDTEKCSSDCTGVPLSHEEYKKQMNGFRCVACRKVRNKLQNQSYKTKSDYKERYDNLKYQESLKNKQIERLQRKNKLLKKIIDTQKANCLAIKDDALRAEISILPPIQQLAIRVCFNAAKVSNPKQRRYTVQWVYECLLLRIKSASVYDRLREREILTLPCKDTLNRYIQKLNSAFGFPKAVFDTLRIKSGSMEVHAKRGTLLIDEVALSEAIKLNRKTMQLDGFVNLGAHTPQNLQDTRADHALVFMFQPFQGDWVQVVGSFLSRNSVTSAILHKLLIEFIILLENAGLFVDVITSDGAQWNRGAWTLFGIKDGQCSCEHPCNSDRRLYFVSDFPHLIKCFRNKILEKLFFWTPDGFVKKSHWETLLIHENYLKANLKIAYKLTPQHLNPEGYQKMNVPLAYQLFSKDIQVAMKVYKNKTEELRDCDCTIAFIEKVNNLIQAMSSRTPSGALRSDPECPRRRVIFNILLKFLIIFCSFFAII